MSITRSAVYFLAVLLVACSSTGENPGRTESSPVANAPAPLEPQTAAVPSPAPAPVTRSAAPTPPPVMKFDDAIAFAVSALFRNAPAPGDASRPQPVVIDPLIDGNTGERTKATQAMGAKVSSLVTSGFPAFRVAPLRAESLNAGSLVFIGTLTPVDAQGGNAGAREWYRVCLALVDPKSGKIVSKGFARASPEGVDHAATRFFEDQPVWTSDARTSGYVRTCQGTSAGDAIKPEYLQNLTSSVIINDAIDAYEKGRYRDALLHYQRLETLGTGNQLRALNGVYLANWKLGRRAEASKAFGKIVDFGLENKRLGVRFLFRPGSTAFVANPSVSSAYPGWIAEIAKRAAPGKTCLEVSGHASRSGAEPQNLKLSTERAERLRAALVQGVRAREVAVRAIGKGSSEAISGLGTDDQRDAVDRRVEFKPVDCKAS